MIPVTGMAQSHSSHEYKVKVAYVYKIAHYVHHAQLTGLTADDKLVIGILGEDPFGPLLRKIAAERKIHSKSIQVKRFQTWPQEGGCHLLFVSKTATPATVNRVIEQTRGKSILLVGETEGFEQIGGTFNLYLDANGKVGLKLNLDAAERSQFRVDARLLQVCDVVRDETPKSLEETP